MSTVLDSCNVRSAESPRKDMMLAIGSMDQEKAEG